MTTREKAPQSRAGCLPISFCMRASLATLLLVIALPAVTGAAEPQKFPSTPPLRPEDARRSFHVLEGFEMQLMAAEPLVADPVSITYDEDGRAYVCEMSDYPYTDKARHKPSQENPTDQPVGKVRLLEDTDGDGVFDKSTVFARELSWPTGAVCWKGGIFVTATPDVWYLKDTDGDGQADIREKVFTGFRKLNVQAVMNNPVWGMDHRIYVAGGSNGAQIIRPGMPGSAPVTLRRHDFSFEAAARDVRVESGGARFGNGFDDWGNRFLCNIRNPCQHVSLPYSLLAKNLYATFQPLVDCAAAGDQLPVYRTSPVEPWRDFRARRWAAEGSTLPKSELVGAGVVTSSAGIAVYRGDAYPAAYRDFAFVADVAGNLFYRMNLVPKGMTFEAVQVDAQKNFCTSDDVWFRPVNFVNAPDGCLHVCDMYREVIEHPWSIPDDIHAGLDLLSGMDKGRLWRLAPASHKPRAAPKLGACATADLVALLDHPNAWHRETAHRLIYERQDAAVLPALRQMVRTGKTPQGRIHALWSLAGLGDLGPGRQADFRQPDRLSGRKTLKGADWLAEAGVTQQGYGVLLEASQDADAQVRRQALRMRPEALLAPRSVEELYQLRPEARRLLEDRADIVSLEAIVQHALITSPAAYPVMAELVLRHPGEAQFSQAILLGTAESSFLVFQEVLKSPAVAGSPPLQTFLADLATMIGRAWRKGDPDAPYHVVKHLAARPQADALALRTLASLAQGLRQGGGSLDAAAFAELRQAADRPALQWLERLKAVVRSGLEPGGDVVAADRMACLQLGPEVLPAEEAVPCLIAFLTPSYEAAVQSSALAALGGFRSGVAVAQGLVVAWPNLSPALREQALTLLLALPERTLVLLAALDNRSIAPAQVSLAARSALLKNKDAAVSARAEKLFGAGVSANRREVIARYETALGMKGDAARGAKVYELACMVCHRFQDRGNDVGPNLGTVQGWTPEQLLTNILDPNREVSPNFSLYLFEMHDGRSLSGMIASETATGLTLKRADGGSEDLPRTSIRQMSSSGISLMPEGLEAAISPAQMADLLAYLLKK